MSRDALLTQLSAVDFYLFELNLYLNTHPTDSEAIALYNSVAEKSRALRDEYERLFGMLTANQPSNKLSWQWIESPWPWQKSFNFELTGDLA